MKNNKGITLIALVVTIVVLLILAGVSISMLTGENGIITQAQTAKTNTRAGTVRDEVSLWKSENRIRSERNEEKISKEDMLNDLKNKELVYEEEIDRIAEIIRIGENEIPYGEEGDYLIEIIKVPEDRITSQVILQVTNVEGIGETIKFETKEDLLEKLAENLQEYTRSEKEQILIESMNKFSDMTGQDIEVNNIDDVVKYLQDSGQIGSKEDLYKNDEELLNQLVFDMGIISGTFGDMDYENKEFQAYIVKNPDGELSKEYNATENGEYTFTVEDILTGKTYSKTISVHNIDNTEINYYVGNYERNWELFVTLLDKETNNSTKFEEAYIYHEGEWIDVTEYIQKENDIYFINGYNIKSKVNLNNEEEQFFILVKDGVSYVGKVLLRWAL